MTGVFEAHESAVRLYCRKFPAVFTTARGSTLVDEDGREYLDFFCGAGALNYGHNDPRMIGPVIDYLTGGGLLHGLDMHTTAKREFLTALVERVLAPSGLDHKVQFCGPTGADAVEAALKLARKATGRTGVVAFTGAFHGMSHGSLSVTGSRAARRPAGPLPGVTFVPYADGPAGPFDSVGLLERLWDDAAGGPDLPAAVIVESVQMDGGIYPAPDDWLRALREATASRGILLICDEIQAGCGRTTDFFGFTRSGITPDLITLSKSLGGAGLPISVLLIRPDLDVWSPGEHTGTFRGNQLAFVAGAAALRLWSDPDFLAALTARATRLAAFAAELDQPTRIRGMALGVDTGDPHRAEAVQATCFAEGLVLETCGRADTVLKVTPPLTIAPDDLERGLTILAKALR